MSGEELLLRCADGRGCGEVVDRLLAADRSAAAGEHDVARELRQAAARWADAHGRGSTSGELGETG